MTRLPFITQDHLDADQQAVWDAVTNGKRGPASRLIDADGGLVGPFNAPLHAPRTGMKVVALGEALRFETEIDRRLLEVAVCTVGAHWRSNFEWFAHSRLAIDAGVDAAAIEALGRGEDPVFGAADEQAVYAMAHALMTTGRVDDATYAEVADHVGHQGLVELTQLIGYYCLISLTLNTFQVELPPGNEPRWPYTEG
ncbi:MAG: carboxymuconolactone decarboxylase family protein [Actinomycetota bacterium]